MSLSQHARRKSTVNCDTPGCANTVTFTCDYRGRIGQKEPDEGQINRKIASNGWALIRGQHLCPGCAVKRRAGAEKPNKIEQQGNTTMAMPQIAAVTRTMSEDTRLDIMEVLFSAYDRKAKRYTGTETDRSVAEAVGNGCMPGWVAKVREDNFGPAGNEEAEKIRTAIEELKTSTNANIAALTARLDALYAAADKRIGGKAGA